MFAPGTGRATLLVLLVGTLTASPPLRPATVTVNASNQSAVTIGDYFFQPSRLNVTTGTTVVWTYVSSGISMHTVTSVDNKTDSGLPVLSSGPISPGHGYSYTFYNPGVYTYQCGFHPIMTGWVNATGPAITPPPSPNPGLNLPIIPIVFTVAVAALAVVGVAFYRTRRGKPMDARPAKVS